MRQFVLVFLLDFDNSYKIVHDLLKSSQGICCEMGCDPEIHVGGVIMPIKCDSSALTTSVVSVQVSA